MLYYIIPPIIIVLSLSALVFILFRKVEEVPEEVLAEEGQAVEKKKGAFMLMVGHFGLKILERIMQHTKLISLKMHNMTNTWFHRIKSKREQQMTAVQEIAEEKEKEVKPMITPVASMPERKIAPTEPPVIQRRNHMEAVQPRVTRPDSIVPKPVVESSREKLEEVLIKRIAINPRDIEAYERLGDHYMEGENLPDALECYRQVLKLSPVHHKAKVKIRKIERLLQ